MTIPDIWINDKPYMLEGAPSGLATSANPAAVGVGGGGEFKDYTQWSTLTMSSWALGVGYKDVTAGGFLYSELETRFTGKIKLPPKIDYSNLGIESNCQAYFAEDCGNVYLAYGRSVYLWSGSDWGVVLVLGHCATGLTIFDEYLHIGQGLDNPYVWYGIISQVAGVAPFPASGFYNWGGFLYSWDCNVIRYTSGGHSDCNSLTVPPSIPYDPLNPAPGWQWTEILIGPCDGCECINGLAGIYLGSLGQSRLYVSTPSQLYAILPGDVVMSLAAWPGSHIDNGRGMVAYNGSIYAPVGDGLFRIAGDGSIIQIGIDNNEGLPCHVAGKHSNVIVTTNSVLTTINGMTNTVWAWAEGWHYIAKFDGLAVTGGYYSAFYERLFLAMDDGNIASLKLVDQRSASNLYAEYGIIDLGWIYGGLRLATKDFHDVIIDGEDITPDTPVNVYYSVDDQNGCVEPTRILLGTATSNTTYLAWPCAGAERPQGKHIRLWVELLTRDETRSPTVRNIALRFLPHVVDQARWHYAIELNKDCMVDACGAEIEGYNQKDWDCTIRAAIVGVQPVKFRDFDGAEYYVKVMDWARRIYNREVIEDDQLKFDLSWSLTLVQACPETLIVC